jgi:SAM-dependent methyltransferase
VSVDASSAAPAARPPQPRLSSSTYPVRAPLLAWLTQEAAAAKKTYGHPRVLDVGCGIKPYEPLFAPFAASYVGVDVENPAADLIGTVEQIPVGDESQDVVLCTQVLEHALDPAKAVAELWRVTAPGGRVLASTHGVQVFHPAPVDLWRWTHGARLFRETGSGSVTVRPPAPRPAWRCSRHLPEIVARRLHAEFLGKPGDGDEQDRRPTDGPSAELRSRGQFYANFTSSPRSRRLR